jgi:pilus assembly protein CpaE
MDNVNTPLQASAIGPPPPDPQRAVLPGPANGSVAVPASSPVGSPANSSASSSAEAPSLAVAYVRDQDSEMALLRSFTDLGIGDGHVVRGDISTATSELMRHGSPRFLVVDVSGRDDPMVEITRLAEVCDPMTEVIAIGDRNDIVLYRDMKAAGVAEYFFKPVISSVLTRVLGKIATGTLEQRTMRTGKLIVVLGVRGGVGATTIATQTTWYLAEERQRRALLLDLDLQSGDAALQLDTKPNHALREALDHPDRVDDLFLDRGVTNVTPRLGLFAALEPLSDVIAPAEESVQQLLNILTRRYRFVVVDVPTTVALCLPKILQLATTILLVSDGSLMSAREVSRWRQRIGSNTPDRSTFHVLNRKGADGALPDSEFVRALAQPPDFSIAYDRNIAKTAIMGAKALHESAAMRRGIGALARELAGAAADPPRSFWRRMLG